MIGKKLGRFLIIGSLGAGGMGEAYRARIGKQLVCSRGLDAMDVFRIQETEGK